jgi:catechol 2,3-dioxygenase-like lactoylglutathione lyase family enzyme
MPTLPPPASEDPAGASVQSSDPQFSALIDRIAASRRDGTLDTDEVQIERTSGEEVDDLRRQAEELVSSRGHGESTVSVTIRMRPEVVDRLRLEAHSQGVRGYQTLLKQWIDERLAAHTMISTAEVARSLEPIQQLLEGSLGLAEHAYATSPEAEGARFGGVFRRALSGSPIVAHDTSPEAEGARFGGVFRRAIGGSPIVTRDPVSVATRPTMGSSWPASLFIEVPDLDATLRDVESQGGRLIVGPIQFPGGAAMAVFADANGNVVGLSMGISVRHYEGAEPEP